MEASSSSIATSRNVLSMYQGTYIIIFSYCLVSQNCVRDLAVYIQGGCPGGLLTCLCSPGISQEYFKLSSELLQHSTPLLHSSSHTNSLTRHPSPSHALHQVLPELSTSVTSVVSLLPLSLLHHCLASLVENISLSSSYLLRVCSNEFGGRVLMSLLDRGHQRADLLTGEEEESAAERWCVFGSDLFKTLTSVPYIPPQCIFRKSLGYKIFRYRTVAHEVSLKA